MNWSPSSPDVGAPPKPPRVEEPQQVFIGIFPASHIHVRDELSDAEGRLAEMAAVLNGTGNSDNYTSWQRDRIASSVMESLREEDGENDAVASRKSFRLGPPPEQATSSRSALPVHGTSIRSVSPSESQQPYKPLPPRPSLKSGDDTASGQEQPIIDEVASALREWHSLMFQYLARRDYNLFHIVRDHIEVLHLGRRQLLAQTLSADETINLRRDCVARLVSGNVVQNLDIIVRHPTWGGLVTVDVQGEIDPRSWVSAVRMYAMQVSLAYIDVSPDNSRGSKIPALGPVMDYSSITSLPTPAHSAFPDLTRPKGHSRQLGSLAPPPPSKRASTKFYHIFLELRAFVASPCSPGETAELYFSLYDKAAHRFISEDFCVILNHNGVLARDPTAHIRTLFTDLLHAEAQTSIYLVCKIVRNGALKIGSNTSTSPSMDSLRRGSDGSVKDIGATSWVDSASINSSNVSSTQISGRTTPSPISESTGQFRRPFGCAILELTDLNQFAMDFSEASSTKECTMPIYTPVNEAVFSMLHQDIIVSNTKEFIQSPRYVITSFQGNKFYSRYTQSSNVGSFCQIIPWRCIDYC